MAEVCYLGHVWGDAVGVVGPGTGAAVYEIVSILFSAHQAVLLACCLVDTLVAIPITQTCQQLLQHHPTLTSLPRGSW